MKLRDYNIFGIIGFYLKEKNIHFMKNVLKLIFGIFILSSLFIGCSDDDDENSDKTNQLKVEDQSYDLGSGMLINLGADEEEMVQYKGYLQVVALVSDGIDLINETGSGPLLLLKVFSSTASSLDTGDYTFDNTPPFEVRTFADGGYTLNFDTDDDDIDDLDDIIEIVSGTISVNKNGSRYKISAKCKDKNGKTVTAYYDGSLIYVDLSAGTLQKPKFIKLLD